jgi:hypothetical protein
VNQSPHRGNSIDAQSWNDSAAIESLHASLPSDLETTARIRFVLGQTPVSLGHFVKSSHHSRKSTLALSIINYLSTLFYLFRPLSSFILEPAIHFRQYNELALVVLNIMVVRPLVSLGLVLFISFYHVKASVDSFEASL